MRRLVIAGRDHPLVREYAVTLTRLYAQKDHLGELGVLFRFVRDQVRYVRDPSDVEALHTADAILRVRSGDCDDKCIVLAALAESIGIETRFVAIGFDTREYSHVYVEASLDGRLIAADPTEPVPLGWAPPDPVIRMQIDNGDFDRGLGNAQDGQIGGQIGSNVGNVIGAITGIPGLGQVLGQIGGLIGGLFGPGVHRTPGGETYDQATYLLHQGYFQMMDLANQVRAAMKLPPQPTIGFVGLGTPTCNALPDSGSVCPQCSQLNCGQVNAPFTGPYLAKLLGDPAYASYTSENQMTSLQATGAYDAGIKMQQLVAQHLQFVLESLQSGTMVVANGVIVPAGAAPDYNTATNTPAPPPGSYQGVQSAAQTGAAASTSPGSPSAVSVPLVALGGMALLIFVLAIRR